MHEASSEQFDFPTATRSRSGKPPRRQAERCPREGSRVHAEAGRIAGKCEAPAGRFLGPQGGVVEYQLGLPEPGQTETGTPSCDSNWSELASQFRAASHRRPSAGAGMDTEDDFKMGALQHEAGKIAKPAGITCMLEFARTSRFADAAPDRADDR